VFCAFFFVHDKVDHVDTFSMRGAVVGFCSRLAAMEFCRDGRGSRVACFCLALDGSGAGLGRELVSA